MEVFKSPIFKMMRGYEIIILLAFSLYGVFAVDVRVLPVEEGQSVTLNFTKEQHDKMLWYFNNTRIALINGEASKSCLYDGEGGIFRGRLKVDYKSGSLTITDITPEHAGLYEAELIRSESKGKTKPLNGTSQCDSTKITSKISSTQVVTFNVIVSGSAPSADSAPSAGSAPFAGSAPSAGSGLSAGAVAGIALVFWCWCLELQLLV